MTTDTTSLDYINLVKISLVLKNELPIDYKDQQVCSGFFGGLLKEDLDTFIVLTKNFSDYTLYNIKYFFIMDIVYKSYEEKSIEVYKCNVEDQELAIEKLNALLFYFQTKNRVTVDSTLIDLTTYDVKTNDLLFVDEESLLENIHLTYTEAGKKAGDILYNKKSTPSIPSTPAIHCGVTRNWPAATVKSYSGSKQPMFFKRTLTTKPSKKTIEKLRNMPCFIEEANVEAEEIELENNFMFM